MGRKFEMKKISLNTLEQKMDFAGKDYQLAIMSSFLNIVTSPALKNYHSWLYKNNFSYEMPNPTNEIVAPFYGIGPLWKTEYSQGVVVKAEDDDDYYIVMECSSKNKGYEHTKVILTMGGCI